jgi:hypothetical protein
MKPDKPKGTGSQGRLIKTNHSGCAAFKYRFLSIFVERSDEGRKGEKRISNKEELRRREFQSPLLAQRRAVYTYSSPPLM